MDGAEVMITSLDSVARSVLEHYELSPRSDVTLINVSENTTYKVVDPDSGRVAAMRVHRPGYHSGREIESELLWLDALSADGVVDPPTAIRRRDGGRLTTLPVGDGDSRHVVLFDWMDGAAPSTESGLEASFEVLGRLAAAMHLHGGAWARPSTFTRYTCDYDAALGARAMWGRWQDGLGMGADERRLLQRVDDQIRRELAAYGTDPARFGLAHNDLRLTNLLVDGDQVKVIDFDDCGFSWFLYDFATAVSFLEADPRASDWMQPWLAGYQTLRPLTSTDVGIIPTLVMFRRLLLVGWVGSHHSYAEEARELGAPFTTETCELAESYLSGTYLA